jgi:Protein of unknown function (DUF3800)
MLFAVDDSEIEIEGRPHTILSAVGFKNPEVVESELNQLKMQFGLLSTDEIKWNGMKEIPRKGREELSEELISLLSNSVPLAVICEGRDKQNCAQHLIEQIADCLRDNPHLVTSQHTIQFLFDEGIITYPQEFQRFLSDHPNELLNQGSLSSIDSKLSPAVQLADVYAGFNRRATTIALDIQNNPQIQIWDNVLSDTVSFDLLSYICISFRYAIWGSVSQPDPPDDFTYGRSWPFKHVGGYGLRIHSTISTETVERIYKSRVVFMGCMH